MPEPEVPTPKKVLAEKKHAIPPELLPHIPIKELFEGYIERNVDKRLARAYDLDKYPLTQGKQGTGKTLGHQYYAYKRGLPMFLFCCYEDFILEKLFGDRTIKGGDVKFQETEFTKAIQNPSLILFDEINALSHANTIQFNTLLQNRCLFIKDAEDGRGKVFRLHPDCHIGFAQNPKSRKYVGGNIRSSNFLGRCVHITYPEFTKEQLDQAIIKRFPELTKKDRDMFIAFYGGIVETIEQGQIPIDVSIRQLINIIDFWIHGADLKESLEDGLICMTDSASQPKSKDALWRIAQAVWKELMKK
ncbi:hypothetical protein LCGC14_1809840 [marine sediment metagenome]|uniref:ATPase dynein-related AAA domain-containing protein n=1 Tax=marine sediment metagenome TaxID=412755 RepID=A0A0F9J1X4_9ZZZZ